MYNFAKTTFVKSASDKSGFIKDDLPQVCFVGRSNVGKSSLINMLCMQNTLARTSNTPGRTRLVNYFKVDGGFYLVDLPGYGYQKGSKSQSDDWDNMMDDYFVDNDKLKMVFLLMDIRRDVSELDFAMQSYLFDNDIPYKIVLTKADKLSNNEKFVRINELCKQLRYNKEALILTSADKKLGRQQLIDFIESCLVD